MSRVCVSETQCVSPGAQGEADFTRDASVQVTRMNADAEYCWSSRSKTPHLPCEEEPAEPAQKL